jgi:hypothetical protein
MIKKTAATVPTPMPALAPVDSPVSWEPAAEESVDVGWAALDVAWDVTDVMDCELVAVDPLLLCVVDADVLVWLVIGVLVALA